MMKNGGNDKKKRQDSYSGLASVSGLTQDLTSASSSAQSHEKFLAQQKKISKAYNGNATRRVWVGRLTFLSGLVLVAGLLGFLAHKLLSENERAMASAEYHAKIGRTLNMLTTISKNKLHGCYAVAKMAGNFNPDPNMWPFISVPGYYDIMGDITPTSLVGGMSISPMVTEENLVPFEEYAKEFYSVQFPGEESAMSAFGFGIFVRDKNLPKDQYPDGRYHRINTTSPWGSPYNFASPKFLHSKGNHNLLLMDSHATPVHGTAVDGAYNCSLDRAKEEDYKQIGCQTVSEMIPPSKGKEHIGPGAFIVTPIYPANSPTLMKGLIFAKINWIEILQAVQLDDVSGIDAIISTHKEKFTYTILEGEVQFVGEGALDTCASDSSLHSEVKFLGSSSLSESSVVYTMSFCANSSFYDHYTTNYPIVAAITVISIILFTTLFFMLYDFFVRREFSAKQELLHAKRQFVRFVSHEVRTPLNSVVMGLTLLQEELSQSLGYAKREDIPDTSLTSKTAGSEDDSLVACNDNDDSDDKRPTMKRVSSWYRFAEEVQVNAQSSVDVLNDLLNYDKIEAGTLALELTVVNIWELIAQTAQEFRLPAARKEINLEVSMPEADELKGNKAVGDVIRLTQVLRNLISNAIKFTPKNGTITVAAYFVPAPSSVRKTSTFDLRGSDDEKEFEYRGFLELQVKDSGAGMSRDQLKNLFKQGVQFNVNELQQGNGSGLGLYIAKGICEQHQGSMTADSPGLGHGTVFHVNLPIYHVAEPEAVLEAAPHQSSASFGGSTTKHCATSAAEQPPLNILIVDDYASNRKLLSRLLSNRGHKCDGAENGQEGVDMVKQAIANGKPYDMLLLDYEMPVMNGPTAAKTLRSLNIDVFIVGVTGNMLSEDVEYFKGNGANAVLPKPFKVNNLEELIMEYDVGAHVSHAMMQDNDGNSMSSRNDGDGNMQMVRVESGGKLVEMGDEIGIAMDISARMSLANSVDDTEDFDIGLEV